MTKQSSLILLLSASVAASALLNSASYAQTADSSAASDSGSAIQEVVVTTRKRAESAQKTPLAISAFTSDQLAKQQIAQLGDLEHSVPGFSLLETQADVFNGLVSLRGISTLNDGQNQDPSVGVYVDGVYQGFAGTQLRTPYDVARIEVAKGPQGTLFGRNSTGGAINIIHNLPTDEFEGWVKFGYADNDQHEGAALLNIPIVPGVLALRSVGGYLENNGYGQIVASGVPIKQADAIGTPLNNLREYNISETLRFTPVDKLEIIGRVSFERGRSNGGGQVPISMTPGVTNGAFDANSTANWEAAAELGGARLVNDYYAASGILGASCTAACQAAAIADAGPLLNQARALYLSHPGSDFEDAPYAGAPDDTAAKALTSLTINYDVDDDLQIKSITSVMRASRYVRQDFSGGGFNIAESIQDAAQNQLTQEIQGNGTTLDGKLKYSAGVFYYSSTAKDDQAGIFYPTLFGPLGVSNFPARDRTTSVGPYAQVTYALTNKINVTGGLRWTDESKEVENVAGDSIGTFRSVSYLGSIDYSPMEGILTYLKTSRGFVSGGQQESGLIQQSFAPEIVTDYEFGVKSDFFAHRLRVNADVYHEDYTGVQQSTFLFINNTLNTLILNAGNATVDGFEAQVSGKPIREVTLGLDYAYTFPQYQNWRDPALGDLSHTPFSNVLRNSVTLRGDYDLATQWGPVNFHLDWHWQSHNYFAPEPTLYSIANGGTPIGQGPYAIMNGKISFNYEARDLDVSFFAKNITNKHYYTYGYDGSGNTAQGGAGGFVMLSNGDTPRTLGFEITQHF